MLPGIPHALPSLWPSGCKVVWERVKVKGTLLKGGVLEETPLDPGPMLPAGETKDLRFVSGSSPSSGPPHL